MANQYRSFYLADIMAIIDRVAVELLTMPVNPGAAILKNPEEHLQFNNNVAWNNEGIRDFARSLKDAFQEEADKHD